MRYFMCGGGTGGHINPALSIAGEIASRDKDAVIEFGGTSHGMETSLVPKAGYKLNTVEVYGFKRKFTLKNFKALYCALTSVSSAKKILKKFNPDIVIGTGGYASWPYVRAATKLKIPTLIQEQNAFPGVTTKKLSRYVDRICTSFEGSEKFFENDVRHKIVLTGNPVKANPFTREEAREKLGIADGEIYILSCGGSLGANAVNEYCIDAMEIYKDKKYIKQIHSVGKAGWSRFSEIAESKGLNSRKGFEITEYIFDMPLRMAAADIVIARAGAITTSELSCLGRATVFIPSPYVAEDHQYKNASVLSKADAAIVYRENEINGKILADKILELAENTELRNKYAHNMLKFGKPDAIRLIGDEIFGLINK